MGKNAYRSFSLVVGLSLLATGCRGHAQPKANALAFGKARLVNSPPPNPIANTPITLNQPVDPFLHGEERPSPFSSTPVLGQPRQAAAVSAAGDAQQPDQKPAQSTKPFTPPGPLVTKSEWQKIEATLPAPPAVGPAAFNPGQSPRFAGTIEGTATATYELAKPNLLRRVIHKLPRLRKYPPGGGSEFVPPRPIHEIQLVLPPGRVLALAQEQQIDLKASIDASGRVIRVEALTPRDEELVTLAAYAARDWKFEPAKLDERAVPEEVILHFHFDRNPAQEK
jgi:hypothetical protein